MSENKSYRIGPGASSLLMIFVALCMTTVSVLTLISALGDSRMTDRSQEKIHAYYTAGLLVQQRLADIDATLVTARQAGADPAAYAAQVDAIAKSSVEEKQVGDEGVTMAFAVMMDQQRQLVVRLNIPLVTTGPRYTVLSEYTQGIGEWAPDADVPVYRLEE